MDESEIADRANKTEDACSEKKNESTLFAEAGTSNNGGLPENADTPRSDDPSPSSSCCSTSSETVCRICQDGDEEGNELIQLGCSCRGSVRLVHENCLLEWITSQRSVICELCHSPFAGVNLDHLIEYEQHYGLRAGDSDSLTSSEEDFMTNPPHCYNARRFWVMCIVVMMGLSLTSCFIQTVIISREYHSAQDVTIDWGSSPTPPAYRPSDHEDGLFPDLHKPSSPGLGEGDRTLTVEDLEDMRFSYLMSLAVLALTAVITVGTVLLWVAGECCVWPLEKFVEAQLRVVRREMPL